MEESQGFSITCEEHEQLISRLKDWRRRSGIKAPKIEVRFEDLSVETEVHASGRVLPTLPNVIINTAQPRREGALLSTIINVPAIDVDLSD